MSSVNLFLGHEYIPEPREIASALARVPRWNGATSAPWSVLQHSLVVGGLAGVEIGSEAHLFGLWHDAEEAVTGDIPLPYKTPEQDEYGETLRRWTYNKVLGLPYPSERTLTLVREIDREVAHAEAHVFLHPRRREDFDAPDMDLVDLIYETALSGRDYCVELFVSTTHELQELPNFKQLARRV